MSTTVTGMLGQLSTIRAADVAVLGGELISLATGLVEAYGRCCCDIEGIRLTFHRYPNFLLGAVQPKFAQAVTLATHKKGGSGPIIDVPVELICVRSCCATLDPVLS